MLGWVLILDGNLKSWAPTRKELIDRYIREVGEKEVIKAFCDERYRICRMLKEDFEAERV